MKHKTVLTVLVLLMAVAAILATGAAIVSQGGPGSYSYESIRGQSVKIYGQGLYQHMSADVAIQGIAEKCETKAG